MHPSVSNPRQTAPHGQQRTPERPNGSKCQTTCVRPSPAQAHCTVCHRTFGSVKSGFDKHRSDGACLDPATLGMVERGGIWRTPMDPEATARLRARTTATEETP